MSILGINDSHDAGASLVSKASIKVAVNEERFTKNKNEVGFPYNSLGYCNELAKGQEDIEAVALAWIGGNALISRMFPSWDVKRRKMWRKELPKPSRPTLHLMNFVYKLIQNQKPRALWKLLGVSMSKRITQSRLRKTSKELEGKKIYVVEHHLAHAASAYYTSGFKEALILTLDGAGDGLSGTVSLGDNGEIKRLAEFDASASLGIMYGAATVACDMRYSEDEGKLMSLAAYSYPKQIEGLHDICTYDVNLHKLVSKKRTRNELLLAEYMKDNILWHNDRESFAYAMQRHLENEIKKIAEDWIKQTGVHNLVVSGGLFSNVIVNALLERLPEVKNFYVFPHMGDGGIGLGAALYIDHQLNGAFSTKQIQELYFGPEFTNEQILEALKNAKTSSKISYEEIEDPADYCADLIAKENKIVLWFQGRMEYGPRALGNRSILALANSQKNRDSINLIIKKRPYYQPFASSILEEDAEKIIKDYLYPNRFMTVAEYVNEEYREDLVAASHIDHTTRPQIVGKENPMYARLLQKVKKEIGIGAVLNTSFNRHGKPIVMAPEDAIWTLDNSGADTLIIGNYLVKKEK
ncbi:MAG: carbamoyltransferase C-terminal domain-containing protein [Candidatus Micrarchaeia archaeon]